VPKKKTDFDFEKALGDLEKLVENMEQGDLSLEESLKHFEQGIALTRACQKALTEAEQKIQILLQDENKQELSPFDKTEKE